MHENYSHIKKYWNETAWRSRVFDHRTEDIELPYLNTKGTAKRKANYFTGQNECTVP
jgi:hypothetical protein